MTSFQGNDLKGVKAYNTFDLDGLYELGTVVVDYRGYRITAQSIIPGILEREQEESVIYGSIDFGKTVVTSDKYKELVSEAMSLISRCLYRCTVGLVHKDHPRETREESLWWSLCTGYFSKRCNVTRYSRKMKCLVFIDS